MLSGIHQPKPAESFLLLRYTLALGTFIRYVVNSRNHINANPPPHHYNELVIEKLEATLIFFKSVTKYLQRKESKTTLTN